MANRGEQPYDPYIPQGGNAAGSAVRDGNTRTAALQQVGDIPSVGYSRGSRPARDLANYERRTNGHSGVELIRQSQGIR